jgi:uncharacterized protein (DUF2141 family)
MKTNWILPLAGLGLALMGTSDGRAEPEPSAIDVIEFRTELRKRGGVVRCGLFRERGWLKAPVGSATVTVKGASALCRFEKIAAGVYGLSAFHDQNSNGKLDTNFVGMPIEDYGASNNARNLFGPPSFEDAKFEFRGGTKRLEARLR